MQMPVLPCDKLFFKYKTYKVNEYPASYLFSVIIKNKNESTLELEFAEEQSYSLQIRKCKWAKYVKIFTSLGKKELQIKVSYHFSFIKLTKVKRNKNCWGGSYLVMKFPLLRIYGF